MFNPFWTAKVWLPKYVPSDITSLNHKDIDKINVIKDINKLFIPKVKLWKAKIALNVTANNDKLVLSGQGLGDTRW